MAAAKSYQSLHLLNRHLRGRQIRLLGDSYSSGFRFVQLENLYVNDSERRQETTLRATLGVVVVEQPESERDYALPRFPSRNLNLIDWMHLEILFGDDELNWRDLKHVVSGWRVNLDD